MEASRFDEPGVTLPRFIASEFPSIRKVLDSLSSLLQAEAVEIQNKYRQKRADYQEGHVRGRSWVHDIRIKNTRNGISIEWIFYKGRYGDLCFSEGIRSEGKLRVPSRNFKSCSAAEREAIKLAEDEFERLRKTTFHASRISAGLTAISQLKLSKAHDSEEKTGSYSSENIETINCGHECGCETPCDELINAWRYSHTENYEFG